MGMMDKQAAIAEAIRRELVRQQESGDYFSGLDWLSANCHEEGATLIGVDGDIDLAAIAQAVCAELDRLEGGV